MEGQLATTVTFGGPLEQIQLAVAATNASQLKVDRLTLERFQGDLTITGNRFLVEQFTAQPTLGGNITGQGVIQLADESTSSPGAIAIAAQGDQLRQMPWPNSTNSIYPSLPGRDAQMWCLKRP